MSPALDRTPYPLWARDVVSDLKSDVEAFSSWDKCMAKAYCKWPVIAAIIIAALIVLAIIACVVNCLCCGIQCCKCCCGCCSWCCPKPRNKRNKTKHLDDPYQQQPMPSMPPPAPINNAYNAPYHSQAPPSYRGAEVARFDMAKSPAISTFNEDALPAMPTWDNATNKRIEDTATYEDVEMKPMNAANSEPRRRPSAAASNVSGYSGQPPLRTVTPGVPQRTGTSGTLRSVTPGMPTRTGTPGTLRSGTPGMPQRTGTPGMPQRTGTPGMPQRTGTPGMPLRTVTPAAYHPEPQEFDGHDAYGHNAYGHDTYGQDTYAHDAYGYQAEPRSPVSPYEHQPYSEYPPEDRFHSISPAPTYTTQPQPYMPVDAGHSHPMPTDETQPHYMMDPVQPHHMPMDSMESHYAPMDAPQSHYMPTDNMPPQRMPSDATMYGHQAPIDRTYSPAPAFHSAMNAPRPIPYRQPSPAVGQTPAYRTYTPYSPASPTSPPPPFSATPAPHEETDAGRPPSVLQSGRRPAHNF
ncbi:hypothetical protein BO70DRAFT_60096 [Aspergillus heteromorphus CBS 117.55]|uniref:Fibroin-3 related protein n=1 Tax=Aspergillus heteromorphus CBS 117.55 TaxID=1448321 RepID=A0A317VX92_9EURO|nr:uncharacterized protein BO70DRAFT_60096 [Aspergillus heteromorphus CBS 117.55]PWY78229.1 hypothetical protein BO70DRAFT_60096 [Aspergillus heteromorphus CBS 117.55]